MAKPVSSSSLSRSSIRRRALGIFVLLLVAGTIAYPRPFNAAVDGVNKLLGTKLGHLEKGFVLGLDLNGGTRLEYKAGVSKVTASEQSTALEGVRDVIERRVNSIGVSEPVVQTAKAGDEWRVSVELAGIRDVNQAIKLIGETPILEFKEANTDAPRTLTADEQKKMDADNAASEKAAEDALARAKKDPGSFEQIVRETSQDEVTKAKGGDLGFIKDAPEYTEIFEQVKADAAGTIHPSVIPIEGKLVVAKVEEVKGAGTEIRAYHLLITYAGTGVGSSTSTKEQARARLQEIQKQATTKNFIDLAKKYSEEPGAATTGGDLNWFGKGVMVPVFEDAAFKVEKGKISDIVESPFGFHLIYKTDERPLNDVRVRAAFFKLITESDILPPPSEWKNTALTGKNLKRSQIDFDQQSGSAQVSLVFDDEGAKLFADITKRNVDKQVAIFLDGNVISAPRVSSEITNGQAVITGSFSVDDAKILAQRLNAGALPVPITLIAQQSVGPTLGQDSVDASLRAGLYGFLFIVVFMLLLYRLPGLLAIGTLALYAGLTLSLFKLLPVTITLSGMAGFILSIGIAVDANVLIFERLKEELRAGKPLRTALEESFKRAWPSIRDGNMTTLISCAVLYWFSSSVIKGFAVTLALGVMLSMFSAIVAARAILRYVASFPGVEKRTWLFPGASKAPESSRH